MINIPNSILMQSAQKAVQDGDFPEAVNYLKMAEPSKQRDEALGNVSYDAGIFYCAQNKWAEAEQSLTTVGNLSQDKVKKELAHQRLVLLKKPQHALQNNEWKTVGRSCSNCATQPNLFNCAVCSRYGHPMIEAELISPDAYCPVIDILLVPAAYRSGYDKERANLFSRLIRLAKRGGGETASLILGEMLADYLEVKSDLRYKIDLIVPVPTSSDRLRRRGYSIPVLIGTSISQRFRIPLSNNALKLTRDTQDTRGLSAQNKQRILQGAFTVDKPEMVKGLRILLIDDIMTTGTTLLCSVKALRLCNPQNVFAAVLAHTEHSWTWEDS